MVPMAPGKAGLESEYHTASDLSGSHIRLPAITHSRTSHVWESYLGYPEI